MILRIGLFNLLFFLSFALFSQQKTIKFETYSLENGLSQSSITGIVQDQFGFIWISTQDGINRYDGYTFKTFKNNPSDDNTIPNNYIHFLKEMKVGTFGLGRTEELGKLTQKILLFNELANLPFLP